VPVQPLKVGSRSINDLLNDLPSFQSSIV
jgi:hypothetical protein